MKTEAILEEVRKGKICTVNFKNKTVRLGRKLINYEGSSAYDFINELRDLYISYKYSTPNHRTESLRKKYFRAEKIDNLSTAQLAQGIDREVAKAKLELFVLTNYLNGNISTLFNDESHWFWQDDAEASLVILKEWF